MDALIYEVPVDKKKAISEELLCSPYVKDVKDYSYNEILVIPNPEIWNAKWDIASLVKNLLMTDSQRILLLTTKLEELTRKVDILNRKVNRIETDRRHY